MACADALLRSLRRQPLLVVLRPAEPLQAIPMLERLQSLGLIHVEIAWQPQVGWVAQMAELRGRFPDLELGAASVCEPQGVDEAASAGCRYAVSPVLDAELLQARGNDGQRGAPGPAAGLPDREVVPGGERRQGALATPAGSAGFPLALLHRCRRTHAGGCAALAGRRGGCGGAWIGSG
jgi:hypothetical protein